MEREVHDDNEDVAPIEVRCTVDLYGRVRAIPTIRPEHHGVDGAEPAIETWRA